MATDRDLAFARRFRALAEERFRDDILEVRIFGSRARGDARIDSDLDLFVRTRDNDRKRRNSLCDLAWDIAYEMELEYPVTVHVMDDAHFQRLFNLERRLARDIVREGVAV